VNIFFTNTFKKAAKKLHRNEITKLEDVIEEIEKNPLIGDLKLGDLSGIRVHKFHILQQLILMAYLYNEEKEEITLLSFSSHENFYKNLKKQLQ